MNTINSISYLVVLLLISSCNPQNNKAPIGQVAKPNVLLIAIDDLNNYLGYLGDPNSITPNMDVLAKRGTFFTNAHCQAPLCGPSRASVMTGIRPSNSGIYGMIRDDSIKTHNLASKEIKFLPEYFSDHGYDTYGVGKIFHSFAPKGIFKNAAGRFAGPKPNHNFGPKPEQRMVWEGYAQVDPKKYGRTSTDWGPFPANDTEMPDYQNTQWAIDKLAQHDSSKPFFMAVGYMRPHVPLHVPKKWFDLYPLDNIKLPPYLENDFDDIPDIAKNQVAYLPMMPTTEWAIQTNNWKKIMQAYLACITFVDNEIGKLLTVLEDYKLADNTVIALWSDHGYRIGEKGTFAKQALWEMATKTPLIFSGPNITADKQIDTPTELLSIYPTLLDLCGLPPNSVNEGISLVSMMNAELKPKETEHYAITTYGYLNHSLRSNDYRYISYEDGSEELYDMNNDPNEFDNLADSPQYNSVINKLKSKLPKENKKWHINSNYTFQPYFVEQKKRINKKLAEI